MNQVRPFGRKQWWSLVTLVYNTDRLAGRERGLSGNTITYTLRAQRGIHDVSECSYMIGSS